MSKTLIILAVIYVIVLVLNSSLILQILLKRHSNQMKNLEEEYKKSNHSSASDDEPQITNESEESSDITRREIPNKIRPCRNIKASKSNITYSIKVISKINNQKTFLCDGFVVSSLWVLITHFCIQTMPKEISSIFLESEIEEKTFSCDSVKIEDEKTVGLIKVAEHFDLDKTGYVMIGYRFGFVPGTVLDLAVRNFRLYPDNCIENGLFLVEMLTADVKYCKSYNSNGTGDFCLTRPIVDGDVCFPAKGEAFLIDESIVYGVAKLGDDCEGLRQPLFADKLRNFGWIENVIHA